MGKRPKWARVGMVVLVSEDVVSKERFSYSISYSQREVAHIDGYIWIIADRRKVPRDAVGFNPNDDWDPGLILCKSIATGGYHYWWGDEVTRLIPEKEEG